MPNIKPANLNVMVYPAARDTARAEFAKAVQQSRAGNIAVSDSAYKTAIKWLETQQTLFREGQTKLGATERLQDAVSIVADWASLKKAQGVRSEERSKRIEYAMESAIRTAAPFLQGPAIEKQPDLQFKMAGRLLAYIGDADSELRTRVKDAQIQALLNPQLNVPVHELIPAIAAHAFDIHTIDLEPVADKATELLLDAVDLPAVQWLGLAEKLMPWTLVVDQMDLPLPEMEPTSNQIHIVDAALRMLKNPKSDIPEHIRFTAANAFTGFPVTRFQELDLLDVVEVSALKLAAQGAVERGQIVSLMTEWLASDTLLATSRDSYESIQREIADMDVQSVVQTAAVQVQPEQPESQPGNAFMRLMRTIGAGWNRVIHSKKNDSQLPDEPRGRIESGPMPSTEI